MFLSPLKNAICLKDVGYLLLKWQCNHWGTGILLSGDFSQIRILVKSTKRPYLGLEAKMEKRKTTLFPQTFEVAENKVPLFFFIFGL